MNNYSLFISCAKGLEYLLAAEVSSLGLHVTQTSPQGVYAQAALNLIYQLCLWSRLANRIQLILFSGMAADEQQLYQLCHQYQWQHVFNGDKTLCIEFHGHSTHIRNTMFGAQVVKDAIVDYYQKLTAKRPMVDKISPNVRLHAYLKYDKLTVSLDLVGYSLHQRGYRLETGLAPIKETLAAAMLIQANWPQLAVQGYSLYDPCCGAGTILIEGAMMAANIAPGLLRTDQAFIHWLDHQPKLWRDVRSSALQAIKTVDITITGTDADPTLVALAINNAKRANVSSMIELTVQMITDVSPVSAQGLLITNPPYGERLGEQTALIAFYQQLGAVAFHHFQHWQLAILTSNPLLAKAIGLRANKRYALFNGAIECKLYCFNLDASNRLKGHNDPVLLSPGAQMVANRLKKNYEHLDKWSKRTNVSCYRLYDADLPEYAYAVDIYNDYVVLQEYKAPATIDIEKTEKRSLEMIQAVSSTLKLAADKLVIKQRKPQKGSQQYQKDNQQKPRLIVNEGQALFNINLYDYIDTGLFLDHRLLRLEFSHLPKNCRFLNCFCYTATASVHAALAGAITTNIDLSHTYLAWAKDNFKLNHLNEHHHQFIQADCLQWLNAAREKFDVIFLDPPSFSNSKRMAHTLDVQRDQCRLIKQAMRLLKPSGVLYFSTNFRRFNLDASISDQYLVKNITKRTIDIDFKRSPRIHQCYHITQALTSTDNNWFSS